MDKVLPYNISQASVVLISKGGFLLFCTSYLKASTNPGTVKELACAASVPVRVKILVARKLGREQPESSLARDA